MSDQHRVNILMVDDQPGKLLTYEAILGELGENLIKASSGREALEALLRNDIAVVLMDVSMPELDGFELADMIRQHPRFKETAIIFISAVHLSDLDRIKAYQRGAVDYISVPVIPELLRAKVSVFAELYRRARQLEVLNRELRRLSSSLISTQDEERRRIARELHDGLGQDLIAAKIMLDVTRSQEQAENKRSLAAAEASSLIDRAVRQVRSISHLLHPPMLDEVGLNSAIQWYLEGLTKRSGIETFIEVQPVDFPRLAPELETAVFRIIQEALTNVFRHSGARKGWVELSKRENEVVIRVRDDGKGVSEQVAEFRPDSIGIGLGGMRQRVKEFGGDLRLENASPGTVVEVIIPIAASAVTVTEVPASATSSGTRAFI
jgi:signal transduction histidine kinase